MCLFLSSLWSYCFQITFFVIDNFESFHSGLFISQPTPPPHISALPHIFRLLKQFIVLHSLYYIHIIELRYYFNMNILGSKLQVVTAIVTSFVRRLALFLVPRYICQSNESFRKSMICADSSWFIHHCTTAAFKCPLNPNWKELKGWLTAI